MMKTKDSGKYGMFSSFAGVYIMFLTVAVPQYWGNLSVYTNSYLKMYHESDPNIKTPWVISLFVIGCTVSMIFAGYVAGVVGHRCTVILGCLMLDSGIALTYFCIQRSVMEVNLAIGLLSGMGNGLILSIGLQIMVLFDPTRIGLTISCVVTSVNIGAAAINQITTAFINPNNLTPDQFDGREKYFTQPDVLNKVPSTFLLLGLISFCSHVTGICLLRPPQKTDTSEQRVTFPANSTQPEAGTKTESVTMEVKSSIESLSPKQVLKCPHFYVLSLGYIITNYTHIMMTNYCKIYGQTLIPDDQFLANLNTILVLVVIALRPCWGMVIDKSSVKTTLILVSCSTCVVSSFWYFTPIVSRWLFLFWTTLFSTCNLGQKTIFPIATLRLFGKDHFSKNYGLVKASCILLNLVAPMFMRWVIGSFGWFYLFLSVACANALCMFLSVTTPLG